MTINPVKRKLKLYKGATFKFQFRIKVDGSALDVSSWLWDFEAVVNTGDAAVIAATSYNSPAEITVDSDDNYLVTIEIQPADTAAISETGQLIYKIEGTLPSGEIQRRFTGTIDLFEDIAA